MKKIFVGIALFMLTVLLVACGDTSVKHTVTFDSVGGSSVASKSVVHDELVDRPTDPTKDGFDFVAWYKDRAYSDEWKFATDKVTEDITLYAKWDEVDGDVDHVVTVTFNFNYSGASAPVLVEVVKGEKIKTTDVPADPTRADYLFLGWSTSRTELVAFNLDSAINENTTLYAAWETTLVTHIVTVDLNDGTDPFDVTIIDGHLFEEEEPVRSGFLFLHWLKDGVLYDVNNPVTSSFTLVANWATAGELEGTPITNPEELVDLFENGGDGSYYLATDIDMSGVDYNGSKSLFTGILDGNNKIIKNLNVNTGTNNKTAAMFGTLDSATIKNLTIMRSSIVGPGEGVGFLAIYGLNDLVIDNLTFVNVTFSQVAGSYSALLFADNNSGSGEMNISNVTVLNNEQNVLQANAFGSVLVAYLRQAVEINFENIYIETDIVTNSGQANAAALVARLGNDGIVMNAENVVYKGTIDAAKEVAIVVGKADKNATINVNNLYAHDVEIYSTNSNDTLIDLIAANNKGTVNATNVYHNENTKLFVKNVVKDIDNSTELDMTQNWFDDSDFNNDFFLYEDGEITHSYDFGEVTAETLTIKKDSYNDLFVKGVDTELDLDNLVVSVAFSDGSLSIIDLEELVIDESEFDPNTVGTQIIYISYQGLEGTIIINVVEIVRLELDTLDMAKLFLVDTVKYDGLVIKAILGDDSVLLLDRNEVDITLVDSNPGVSEVIVSFKDKYSSSFSVTIVADKLTPTDNVVEIGVDQLLDKSGEVVEGIIRVATVKEAINLIDASSLADDVVKKVYISNGTYYEKLRVSKANVHFIGESQENTIIDFDAASGSKTPIGGTWGTQGSATFTIAQSAVGFMATNLTFSNSFDYNASDLADKQAVALVTEADKVIFYKVSFKGHQDTLYAKNGRQWYLDVYVEGFTDFIFGNGGPAYFENSEIKSLNKSNGYITANKGISKDNTLLDYGYVFYNNLFTYETGTPNNSVDLGRPWEETARVAYILNKFDEHITERGWIDWDSSRLAENAFFFEYGNTINDLPYLSTVGKVLTQEQALDYMNKDVVFAKVNGAYDFGSTWDYLLQLEELAPELFVKVTFKVDDETDVVTILSGDFVVRPADPVKSGFNFTGWFVGENEFDFGSKIVENVTIVAKFEEIELEDLVVVTFMDDDLVTVIAAEGIEKGSTVTPIEDPFKEGYEFLGWYLEDTLFVFDTIINEDMTLIAKYQSLEPKVYDYIVYDGFNTDDFFTLPGGTITDMAPYELDDEITITKTIKLNSGAEIKFTTPEANMKLEMVIRTRKDQANKVVKIDGVDYPLLQDNFTLIKITLEDAKEYIITRGDAELGVYYVRVYNEVETEEEYEPVGTPISTVAEFLEFLTKSSGEYYLANDIDFDGLVLTDDEKKNFTGTLDGNFKTLSNLTRTTERGGLFRSVKGATFKNIIFDNVTMIGTNRAGMLAGEALNDANTTLIENITITNSEVKGAANNGTGALLGMAQANVNINNIKVINSKINNSAQASGVLIGQADGAYTLNISNIYAETVTVTSSSRAGGIYGESKNGITINILNAVLVDVKLNGSNNVAAISGYHNVTGIGTVSNVFFNGEINGGSKVGHVTVEKALGTISNLYLVDTTITGTSSGVDLAPEFILDNFPNEAWWETNLEVFTLSSLWEFDETLNVYKLK